MVALLQKKNNVKFLAICTDCLYLLGLGDNNSKTQMLQADAATQLIHIMNTQQYEKVNSKSYFRSICKTLSCSVTLDNIASDESALC